jgi:hypothetical protein
MSRMMTKAVDYFDPELEVLPGIGVERVLGEETEAVEFEDLRPGDLVRFRCPDYPPIELVVESTPERVRIRADGGWTWAVRVRDPGKQRKPTAIRSPGESLWILAEAVRDSGRPFVTLPWVVQRFGVSKSTASVRLHRGCQAGLLKRVARGRYAAAGAGDQSDGSR